MIRESERLGIAAKLALLEAGDPERWGAASILLDELAESQAKLEALIVLVAHLLACEAIEVDRVARAELEAERRTLAALAGGRLTPSEVARLEADDFSSDARRAIAAVALAWCDLDHAPSPARVLAVLALDDARSATAIAAGVELRRCGALEGVPDVDTVRQNARARRALCEVDRAARLLRRRDERPAMVALRAALGLLEGEDAPPVSVARAA